MTTSRKHDHFKEATEVIKKLEETFYGHEDFVVWVGVSNFLIPKFGVKQVSGLNERFDEPR